jgi:hypothetical protein
MFDGVFAPITFNQNLRGQQMCLRDLSGGTLQVVERLAFVTAFGS